MKIRRESLEEGRVRRPAVSGTFYPSGAPALRSALSNCLDGAARVEPGGRPKALIAPHAGYMYSGPIAATAYGTLAPWRDEIRRVVLLGPSHHVAFRGLGTSSAEYFLTPLGPVPLDIGAILALQELGFVRCRDDAHAAEHSLEVHLPFLQQCLDEFRLVPLVVGEASPVEVAEALNRVWGGDETLIVVSTDLSHFHDYEQARRIDAETGKAIRRLDPTVIDGEHACGFRGLNGLLAAARERDLLVAALDERNSGDTAGDRRRVVGYGSYALFPAMTKAN
ncbi:MAG: AmmeMemoRadiSam system protein B [marine benthic group bacterium]|nr:AmmeMemoRadiSam system protein B [Candidatus Benthicola marisminoris]